MKDLLVAADDQTLYDEVITDGIQSRTLIFNSDVDDTILENYIYYILKWNSEDKDLPRNKRKPIRIIFNSNGGDPFIGMGFADTILASTTPVIGVGIGLVASAAFYIYISCHTRVSFPHTVFLQHEGNLSVANSGSKARDTMDFIACMDDRIKEHVLAHTTMEEPFYDQHYQKEYYMYAATAKGNGVVDKIIGEDVSLDEIF
jgi:ATP-dependent Clp protease protease subunit